MVRFDILLINRIRPDGTLLNIHLHARITGRKAVEIVRKWRYCIADGYGFIVSQSHRRNLGVEWRDRRDLWKSSS